MCSNNFSDKVTFSELFCFAGNVTCETFFSWFMNTNYIWTPCSTWPIIYAIQHGDGYEYYFIGCLLLIWLNSFIVGGILWEARWSSFKSVNTRTSRGEARKTADYGRRYTRTKANWKGHENFVPFPTVFSSLPASWLLLFLVMMQSVAAERQYRCWSIIHGDLKDHVFSFAKSQGLKLPDTRTHHTNLTPSALLLLTAVTNDPKTRCLKNYQNSLIDFCSVSLA